MALLRGATHAYRVGRRMGWPRWRCLRVLWRAPVAGLKWMGGRRC